MWITYRDSTQTPPVRKMRYLGWGPDIKINCLSLEEFQDKAVQLSAQAMQVHLATLSDSCDRSLANGFNDLNIAQPGKLNEAVIHVNLEKSR